MKLSSSKLLYFSIICTHSINFRLIFIKMVVYCPDQGRKYILTYPGDILGPSKILIIFTSIHIVLILKIIIKKLAIFEILKIYVTKISLVNSLTMHYFYYKNRVN